MGSFSFNNITSESMEIRRKKVKYDDGEKNYYSTPIYGVSFGVKHKMFVKVRFSNKSLEGKTLGDISLIRVEKGILTCNKQGLIIMIMEFEVKDVFSEQDFDKRQSAFNQRELGEEFL